MTDRQPLPCVLPWKALFMDERDSVLSALPCCANWINRSFGEISESTTLEDLWNGEGAQEIRALMASGRQDELCAPDCPWLASGRFSEAALSVLEGPPAFEDNQRLNHQEIRERRLVLRSKPMAIRVIPTLKCNIRCRMCHQDHAAQLDLPARFMVEMRAMGPAIYDFQLHGGEVLLNPSLPDWAPPEWFADNRQMLLSLITNATVIPARAWEVLRRVRINYVTVSVNAATADTYRFMAGADLFDDVLANTRALRDLGRAHPLRPFAVYVSFVIMRCNHHEVPAFVRLAAEFDLPLRLLLVVGDRLGESIYTDPQVTAAALDAVQQSLSIARPSDLPELERVRCSLAETLATGPVQRSLP